MASLHQTGNSSLCNQARKINKKQKEWKAESKIVFCAHSTVMYTENPNKPTKKTTRTSK